MMKQKQYFFIVTSLFFLSQSARAMTEVFSTLWHHAEEKSVLNTLSTDVWRGKTTWQSLIEQSTSAVVQVRTCNMHFDWIHPYQAPAQSYGAGTAFFIHEDGYLVTNAHVINNAYIVQIAVPGCGKELYTAQVLGMASDLDIALLKIDIDEKKKIEKRLGKIPFLDLGDSNAVVQSAELAVLGYPLGFEKIKVTMGICAGREYGHMASLFHITANINPGNSGGPVLDDQGHVIGVVVSKHSETELIGYAIPINNVKRVLSYLLTTELFSLPYLYIKGNYGSDELCQMLNNPLPGGLYISKISELSLMHQAGVRAGDMLYALIHDNKTYVVDRFGEVAVDWNKDPVPLFEIIQSIPRDASVEYIVYRNGEKVRGLCKITDAERPAIRQKFPLFEKIDYEVFGGLVLMELASNHVPYFCGKHTFSQYPWFSLCNSDEPSQGRIIITDILGGSPAFNARILRPGAIIKKINDQEVFSIEDVRKALALSKGKQLITFEEYYSGHLMVLSVANICESEKKLADQYRFPLSSLIEYLS
jgi:S1-C subfamily serine protease